MSIEALDDEDIEIEDLRQKGWLRLPRGYSFRPTVFIKDTERLPFLDVKASLDMKNTSLARSDSYTLDPGSGQSSTQYDV